MEAIAGKAEQRTDRFNPFPGLRPFEPDEDHLFFGRERETDELLRRLRGNRFVSVLGTSGSGKSSLVRSGLIPSLYSGFMVKAGSDWRVAILRPGEDPIGNLAAALDSPDVLGGDEQLGAASRVLLETSLRRSSLGLADCARHSSLAPHENLLVVVDQFEELFRFRETRREHGSRDEAIAFAKLLLGAAAQEDVSVYVVLTMRSDFIGDCMEYPGLPEAINEGQYLIPRMTREELRQAITGPVAVGGGEITPRLVTRLLNEIGDDPDQLPVLQHALMRSWDRWDGAGGDALDLQHYEDTGTMSEALSRHAEEAYAELDAGGKVIAERLFKALTDKRKDERGVRRPTPVDEVAAVADVSADDVIRVVEVFRKPGRSFLMPPAGVELGPDSIIDLSHESLMRGWTRLVEWVDDETQSGKAFRRLCRAARRYERGQASLWVEPELSLGLKWREESGQNEAWATRYDRSYSEGLEFLDESKAAEDARVEAIERERLAKLRRARIISAVLGTAAVVTLIFGLLAVRAGRIARQAEQVATEQAETARAVSDFLVSLFEVADPEEARGKTITAQEILDEGARKIDSELADQPEVQARMLTTIGKVYGSLGLFEQAQPLLERARETAHATVGAEHPDALAATYRLAESQWNQGHYDGAEVLYLEALEGRRAALGPEHPDTLETLAGLAQLYLSQGRDAEAEETARQAHEAQSRVLGEEHEDTLASAFQMGKAIASRGRFPEAEALLTATWQAQRRVLGEGHPDAIASMGEIGQLYTTLGRYDEAEKLYKENLDSRRLVFGDEHPKTLAARQQLGNLDEKRGQWDRAEEAYVAVLDARRRVLGEEHPNTLASMGTLAWFYRLQGRNDESEKLAQEAFDAGVRTLGEEHATTRELANTLGATYRAQGRFPDTERLYAQNLKLYQRRYGEAHPKTLSARNNLAAMYDSWGRRDRTEELFRENLKLTREARGEDHPSTLFYAVNMISLLNSQRRYDEAEALAVPTLERHRRVLGPDNPETFRAMAVLANIYAEQKRVEEVEEILLELVERKERVFGRDHPETQGQRMDLAGLYQGTKRVDQALPLVEEAAEALVRFYGEEHAHTLGAYGFLAWLYELQEQFDRSLEIRTQIMDIRRRMAMDEDATVTDVERYASAVTYARRELQNPEDALKFSLLANEMSNYENRNYLGTLANAYFLNGRVEEAIETQKKAMALLTEDDIDARTRMESRLAEFYKASGNVDMKRQAQIDEIARERAAAEAPDASPRAKNGYAWELLIADPDDLQDPEEALRVALAVNEETGSQDTNILGTLALAYYRTGQPEKAVEIQDKVVALTPENDVWSVDANKLKRRVFAGEGTTDFNAAEVLPGSWSTNFGPLQVEVKCHREGDYLLWVTQKKLPWIPAGEALARIHVESGVIEYQQSDSGWTNLRWEGGGGLRLMESGDVINWTRDWNVARWQKQATP